MNKPEQLGYQLAAKFVCQPITVKICGKLGQEEVLRQCAEGNISIPEARKAFNNGFPDLHSFVETISQITKQPPFFNSVIESYLFGNPLTESTFPNGRKTLIEQYQIYNPALVPILKEILPSHLYLTHLSQVALILINSNAYEDIETVNKCMVAGGRIISIHPENRSAIVERQFLVKGATSGLQIENQEQTVKIDSGLTPDLKKNDEIAIHRGTIFTLLTREQANNLETWNKRVAALL
jgi:hypothetical protein